MPTPGIFLFQPLHRRGVWPFSRDLIDTLHISTHALLNEHDNDISTSIVVITIFA
jgi:hypothetical protein